MDHNPCTSKKTWRRGRYPEGPTARNMPLTVKVSAIEAAEIRRMAAEKGMTLSEVIMAPLRRIMARAGKKR